MTVYVWVKGKPEGVDKLIARLRLLAKVDRVGKARKVKGSSKLVRVWVKVSGVYGNSGKLIPI
jgi:hypothetical protein